jgi:integrase/recombinase XerD
MTRKVSRRPPELLLALVSEEFLHLCQQNLSAKTCRSYAGPLRLFQAYLRDALGREPLLSDFTLETARQWADRLQERPKWLRGGLSVGDQPVSVETRRSYLRQLRVFANWLAEPPHQYCQESPLRHLRLPKASDTYQMPLGADELARMLAICEREPALGVRDRAMLLLLFDSGLRAMELAHLTVGDVGLTSGVVRVGRGKGNKTRTVAIGTDTRMALRRYAVERNSHRDVDRSDDAPFFLSVRRRAFSYFGLQSWLRRVATRAGVERAHLHLFRHSSAVETLDAGADLRTVQLKLGHASIATTQKYLNMASARLNRRQQQFSPVDHLQLGASKRPTARTPRPPLSHRQRQDD